jgi:hypothetical protein
VVDCESSLNEGLIAPPPLFIPSFTILRTAAHSIMVIWPDRELERRVGGGRRDLEERRCGEERR